MAAAEALRGFIDAVDLTPKYRVLAIEVQANVAAMLKTALA
jgi:hypothetical protein